VPAAPDGAQAPDQTALPGTRLPSWEPASWEPASWEPAVDGAGPAEIPAWAGISEGRAARRGVRRRRRTVLIIVILLVVAAVAASGATAAGVGPLRSRAAASNTAASVDSAAATELASVTRRTLLDRTEQDATLGYSGSYSLVNQAHGTVTELPAIGQVVKPGQVLYRVDGAPVVLLHGSIPAYRSLARGMTGADVQQLNAALVGLGEASSDDLDPTSDEFGAATVTALKKLQDALGVDQTGRLDLGQAIFLPVPFRVTAEQVSLGMPAPPGAVVLQGTSTGRLVTLSLDAAEQTEFKAGDKVTITMPDGIDTPGVVSSVSKVATKPSSDGANDPNGNDQTSTISVEVTPTRPAQTGTLDQADVTVSIVTGSAKDALTVPVSALLALAGGGYAVEVDNGGTRHLVAVTLGLFDDSAGLVQVTGAGLAVGQHVVVPAS
jgi:hypothetical protein